VSHSASFQALAQQIGAADVSSLIALRALVAHCDGAGTTGRAAWVTALHEEYRRWYAQHPGQAAGGEVENFPGADTLRYLDEQVVRQLSAAGALQPLDDDGHPAAPDARWDAVRLGGWAADEVTGDREHVLHLLDARIREIVDGRPTPGRVTDMAAPVVIDVPTAPPHVIDAEPSVDRDAAPLDPESDTAFAADADAEPEVDPDAYAAPETRVPSKPIEGGSTLSARGLVKTYRKRKVVNEVDLHVAQGEIVGLLGPNGAGKTTSFYMMVGLIAPDRGTVTLDRRDLTGVPMFKRARAGIGYLAQEPSIFRRLTVEENILAVLQMLDIPRAEQKRRLETLLDELSIKHLRRSFAYALSGGERRRLEITRALVGNPKFMLLDEPFAGVDPIAVHDIQQIVADLRKRGIGVLISDHNVEQTLDIVDRAYIMYDGRVRVSGTVSELVWNDEVAEIYLGPTLTARMRERYSSPDKETAA